jgi:hypothetical protein
MTCSTSVQIYIKFGARDLFVSRVQTELYSTISIEECCSVAEHMANLEMPKLLGYWELACACQAADSPNVVDDTGTLLVHDGALVDLQWVQQYANMSTNQSNQLELRIF